MKTLFLSDLDGTLLRSDGTLGVRTKNILNGLIARGMLFSYATARSAETAAPLLEGLNVTLPVIVHNGTALADHASHKILQVECFPPQTAEKVFDSFQSHGLFPISYALIDGKNRFSYCKESCGAAQWEFVLSRLGDGRAREIFSERDALDGDVFYFTCIHEEAKLRPVYEDLKECCRCFFGKDFYTGEQWLEVLPKYASKAESAKKLKEMLGCDKIVCFGDARNDLPMFEIADECYAVENAVDELKAVATGIIGANDHDGVAEFLEKYFKFHPNV